MALILIRTPLPGTLQTKGLSLTHSRRSRASIWSLVTTLSTWHSAPVPHSLVLWPRGRLGRGPWSTCGTTLQRRPSSLCTVPWTLAPVESPYCLSVLTRGTASWCDVGQGDGVNEAVAKMYAKIMKLEQEIEKKKQEIEEKKQKGENVDLENQLLHDQNQLLIRLYDEKKQLMDEKKTLQGSQILQTENAGTDLPFDQYTKTLLDSIKPFMCDEMKETRVSYPLEWDDNSPTLDPRIDALYVLDKALEDSNRMGNSWKSLETGSMRLPIAVNCGTAGSGKTIQLKLAMQHFENKSDPSEPYTPRGKALYITFNGGSVSPGIVLGSSEQDCDKEENPRIRVYLRILYSALRCRGVKCPMSLSKFAAAVLLPLKALEDHVATAVVRACRAILELKPEENLLIAADELAKLGKEGQVGVVSEKAVTGLKTLVDLSTTSMVDRRGNKMLGAVYVCGSAYSAYNSAEGVTKGSNHCVYYMPLPPLPVEKDDEKLRKVYSGEALTFARTLLWSSQYNARHYAKVLQLLDGEQAKLLKEGQKICEKKDVPYDDMKDFSTEISDFLDACRLQTPVVDPLDLLRALFWPVCFDMETTAFASRFHAALLADAAGLCTILRDHTAGVDRVYMSPKAVEQLSVELKDICSPLVNEVKMLAQALQKIAAPHGNPNYGKLFEEVMLRAYRCRAAAMKKVVSVAEFLGGEACTVEDVYLRPLQGAITELAPVTVFPHAAVYGEDKFDLLSAEEKENSEPGKDNWYNWPPTPLPLSTQHSDGWSSPVSAGMHQYNAVCDGLLALPTAGGGKPVLFGFQAKEWEVPCGEVWHKARLTHFTWYPTDVNKTLDAYQFVHVLVEAKMCNNPLQLKAEAKLKIEEAIVSGVHTLKWSPMVAYSSCSARMFTKS